MEHYGPASQEPGSEWRLKTDLKPKGPGVIHCNYDNLLTYNADNNLLTYYVLDLEVRFWNKKSNAHSWSFYISMAEVWTFL